MIDPNSTWTETYAGIYYATCDECGHTGNGWFWILNGSHDHGTRCNQCHTRTTLTHTDTRCQWGLCDSCNAGVANDDWTHLDAHPETADEEHARITATLEWLGWLSHVGPYDPGGYWRCTVCDDVCIGTGHVWEGDRPRG